MSMCLKSDLRKCFSTAIPANQGILKTSVQVCWGKLELNSAEHRPARIKFDVIILTVHFVVVFS